MTINEMISIAILTAGFVLGGALYALVAPTEMKEKGKMEKFIQASIGLFLGWILACVIFWAVGYGAIR